MSLDIHPHHLPPVPLVYSDFELDSPVDSDEEMEAVGTGTASTPITVLLVHYE